MNRYRFSSPYASLSSRTRWLKGNHHGHSTISDGLDDPLDLISAYEAAGYDYFALSEHDVFVPPGKYQPSTGMIILPAVEMTSINEQTLMYLGATEDIPDARTLSISDLFAFAETRGGLFIVDHPNWRHRPGDIHAAFEETSSLTGLRGIEIYTGIIERFGGDPYALAHWDQLLTLGFRVHGHAVDDQHEAIDRFLGWNCVQVEADETPIAEDIIRKLAEGRFYASTGVRIQSVGVQEDGQSISIESDAEEVRWHVADGMLAAVSAGGNATITMKELLKSPRLSGPWHSINAPCDLKYVRADLYGEGSRRAWTQPFFVDESS